MDRNGESSSSWATQKRSFEDEKPLTNRPSREDIRNPHSESHHEGKHHTLGRFKAVQNYVDRGRKGVKGLKLTFRRSRSAPSQGRSGVQQATLKLKALPQRSKIGRFVPLGEWDEDRKDAEQKEFYEAQQGIEYPNEDFTGYGLRKDVQYSTPYSVGELAQERSISVEVRCHCIAYQIDRAEVQDVVLRRLPSSSLQSFPGDIICSNLHSSRSSSYIEHGKETTFGDVLIFCSSGVVVFWGVSDDEERHILKEIVEPCVPEENLLRVDRRENDTFTVTFASKVSPSIQNDKLEIHYRHIDDLEVKLAVSAALAQSTELRVCEEDFRSYVKKVSKVPTDLAEFGYVSLKDREIMCFIGELYQHMASVNLLGAVLVTPESVEASPNSIRILYKKCHEYLDIEERLTLLNDRFSVVSEMLELCRTLGHQIQLENLDSIIIWLLAVCVILALFQLAGILGWRTWWKD